MNNETTIGLMDPITVLCKLAVLYFLPEGTKMSIGPNLLKLQETGYFQWVERMSHGDTRHNISNLDIPIILAIKWYILDTESQDENVNQSFKTIARYSTRGLMKLQKYTYKKDKSIKLILQYLIILLQSALDGTWDNKLIMKYDEDHTLFEEKVRQNFESQIINSIAKMFNDAEQIKHSSKDVHALVNCVHNLLNNRDDDFAKIIDEINMNV